MPMILKKCRVCGKEYEACHTLHPNDGVFRWQDVSCSPECGLTYLREVMAARGAYGETDSCQTPPVGATDASPDEDSVSSPDFPGEDADDGDFGDDESL